MINKTPNDPTWRRRLRLRDYSGWVETVPVQLFRSGNDPIASLVF